MGEEPLAETRLAVSAQRTELERTADQLREALDLKKRFKENPALVVGLGAGALFLVAGGPIRLAKLIRRTAFRSDTEKAYDTLPKPMQSWVDSIAGSVGPRAAEARETMSEELLRWRHDPKKHKKLAKKLAKQAAEGPPGPKRAAWNAFETGAAILTAAHGTQGRRALPLGRAAPGRCQSCRQRGKGRDRCRGDPGAARGLLRHELGIRVDSAPYRRAPTGRVAERQTRRP